MTEEKIGKAIKCVFWLFISACIVCMCYFYAKSEYYEKAFIKKGLIVESLDNVYTEDSKLFATLTVFESPVKKDLWCITTDLETKPSLEDENWQEIEDNKCNVQIHENAKYLYIRDDTNIGDKYSLSNYISYVTGIETNKTEIKLIKDQTEKITAKTVDVGNPKTSLSFKSNDENIAKIENNEVIGINDGITTITISDNFGHSKDIQVQVTSLITTPIINNQKPFISNKQYTQEEAKLLDEYLFYEIDKAGYKTRAGVVAAARFLTMQLKYRIPYFIENGRRKCQN